MLVLFLATANALVESWPQIELLHCWPHVLRNTKDNVKHLSASDGVTALDIYRAEIKPVVVWLHDARTTEQHEAMGKIVVRDWTAAGHGQYADWFRRYCLQSPWNRWFAGASTVPGIVPNQNPIEAYHKTVKIDVNLRVSTAELLHTTLPGTSSCLVFVSMSVWYKTARL